MSELRSPAIAPSEAPVLDPQQALLQLNRLFDAGLRALGDAGHQDRACELAAAGWKLLRNGWPQEGERLNGTLHYLTRPPRRAATTAADFDLDVRHLIPAERHRIIFEKWFELSPGAGYVL